jgi:hypothetical protein
MLPCTALIPGTFSVKEETSNTAAWIGERTVPAQRASTSLADTSTPSGNRKLVTVRSSTSSWRTTTLNQLRPAGLLSGSSARPPSTRTPTTRTWLSTSSRSVSLTPPTPIWTLLAVKNGRSALPTRTSKSSNRGGYTDTCTSRTTTG